MRAPRIASFCVCPVSTSFRAAGRRFAGDDIFDIAADDPSGVIDGAFRNTP
jgi:hypothetical protein